MTSNSPLAASQHCVRSRSNRKPTVEEQKNDNVTNTTREEERRDRQRWLNKDMRNGHDGNGLNGAECLSGRFNFCGLET